MVVMKPLISNPPLMRRFLHVGKATTTRRYIKKMQTMADNADNGKSQKCSLWWVF
jgi:hypothetical protein